MASPAPVTVVIPTRNEGAQIAECVGRLAWAAEVIVVDGGSTDETRERARAVGARVLDHPGPTIAHQRNAGIAAASHYLQKLDLYSGWAAEDLAARGRRPRVTDLILRPPARFVRMYFLQLGILDGWRGAVLCGLAAVSVLVKYARLWERSQ